MTVLVLLCNLMVGVGVLAVLLMLLRRPSANWRTGRWGKGVSIVAALVVSTHIAGIAIPIGAIVAVLRHRTSPEVGPDVPRADTWPGR